MTSEVDRGGGQETAENIRPVAKSRSLYDKEAGVRPESTAVSCQKANRTGCGARASAIYSDEGDLAAQNSPRSSATTRYLACLRYLKITRRLQPFRAHFLGANFQPPRGLWSAPIKKTGDNRGTIAPISRGTAEIIRQRCHVSAARSPPTRCWRIKNKPAYPARLRARCCAVAACIGQGHQFSSSRRQAVHFIKLSPFGLHNARNQTWLLRRRFLFFPTLFRRRAATKTKLAFEKNETRQ